MLRLDVERLSDTELKEALTTLCSRFGMVRKVTICRPMERARPPFALVEMSDPAEARDVIETTGGTMSGVAAIIRLVPSAAPSRDTAQAE